MSNYLTYIFLMKEYLSLYCDICAHSSKNMSDMWKEVYDLDLHKIGEFSVIFFIVFTYYAKWWVREMRWHRDMGALTFFFKVGPRAKVKVSL